MFVSIHAWEICSSVCVCRWTSATLSRNELVNKVISDNQRTRTLHQMKCDVQNHHKAQFTDSTRKTSIWHTVSSVLKARFPFKTWGFILTAYGLHPNMSFNMSNGLQDPRDLKEKLHPETHKICLVWNMCDIISDSGPNVLVGAVFSLLLWENSSFLVLWSHRWSLGSLLALWQWCLMGGKKMPTISNTTTEHTHYMIFRISELLTTSHYTPWIVCMRLFGIVQLFGVCTRHDHMHTRCTQYTIFHRERSLPKHVSSPNQQILLSHESKCKREPSFTTL